MTLALFQYTKASYLEYYDVYRVSDCVNIYENECLNQLFEVAVSYG